MVIHFNVENVSIVKKLIRLGADVNFVDNKQRKPIDIAIHRKNTQITEILRDSISVNSCKFVTGKAEDSNKFPLLFNTYFTINEIYILLIPLQFIGNEYAAGASILSYFILLVVYNYMLKSTDPGYKSNKNTLKKLLEEDVNLNDYCPVCICTIKDSTHCYYCNKCVEHIDHHCVWIKKCVGRKNLNEFFLFILYSCVKLLTTVGLSIYGIFQ
jgi:hypothetical protein